MRRHIAIFSLLNPGHLYPTLGLCSELVKRGYRVTYPTTERFADQIRKTGAEPLLFRAPELKDAEKAHPAAHDPKFWELLTSIFWPTFLATAAATISEVEGFYRKDVPDLIFYDLFSFAGRILAKRLDVPTIQHWAHFAHQGSLIREDGVCLNPETAIKFSQLLNAFMSGYGIEDNHGLWHTESLGIYFVPKEFQFDAHSFDNRFCFVGPCLNRPPRAPWKNNGGGKPILLISESAAARRGNFFQLCVEAFADCEYHVVFSVGENSPQKSTEGLPANIEISRDAYNTEILPHAVLMVCQAGMGTVLESLYHGVPVLGVPLSPYHREVAYRVAELGLGQQLLEGDMTAGTLREKVKTILGDTALLSRVRHMQKCLANSGGAKLAVDRIEGFLNGGIAVKQVSQRA